ncbi:uncharacterized protein A4U43_C04F21480 [Asparagus officinalis]|uniref:Uncharacterized protein n=1 Tax=Asparagus officinalis TaxID=4686 RepID=A0A5P1F2R4_ASPOF|nr:uncharacterized protein A4U43_C04F21480 [Asparagus officinalis]
MYRGSDKESGENLTGTCLADRRSCSNYSERKLDSHPTSSYDFIDSDMAPRSKRYILRGLRPDCSFVDAAASATAGAGAATGGVGTHLGKSTGL